MVSTKQANREIRTPVATHFTILPTLINSITLTSIQRTDLHGHTIFFFF